MVLRVDVPRLRRYWNRELGLLFFVVQLDDPGARRPSLDDMRARARWVDEHQRVSGQQPVTLEAWIQHPKGHPP